MASMDWSTQSGDAPARYAEFLVPAMFAPFAERLVQHLAVRSGTSVLDVACGTGAVSRAAARAVGASGFVAGVDLGEPTLAIARAHGPQEGGARIEYVQSVAAALPFDDEEFDYVLCQQGLQFFPDRLPALREMRRVLRPDGLVAVATWKDIEHSPFIAVAEALGRHLGREAGEMMRSPFALADGAELARLIEAAGFRDVVVRDETIECTWATHADFARRAIAAGPVAPLFAAAPEEAQTAAAEHTFSIDPSELESFLAGLGRE